MKLTSNLVKIVLVIVIPDMPLLYFWACLACQFLKKIFICMYVILYLCTFMPTLTEVKEPIEYYEQEVQAVMSHLILGIELLSSLKAASALYH